jgi:hypothetical protein
MQGVAGPADLYELGAWNVLGQVAGIFHRHQDIFGPGDN